jgi:predicted ATPase
MVRFAQELERKRSDLFASLRLYENVVNSFLTNKRILVSEKGALVISPTNERNKKGRLEWRHLSSGEKQILILLTQALLWEREPVVYVADEPELSLHVTWQEKLVSSLVKLAGRCQFIVATHSPDVTGGFPDNIIDLGRV